MAKRITKKFKEHDVVKIKDNTGLNKYGVMAGDSGTIISIYEGKGACCVEIQGILKHPILVDVSFDQLLKLRR